MRVGVAFTWLALREGPGPSEGGLLRGRGLSSDWPTISETAPPRVTALHSAPAFLRGPARLQCLVFASPAPEAVVRKRRGSQPDAQNSYGLTPCPPLPSLSSLLSVLPLLYPEVWSWDEGFLAAGSRGRFLVETFPAPEGLGEQGPGMISVLHISGTQESDFSRGFNCSARNRLGEGGTRVSLGRRGETLVLKTSNLRIPNPQNAAIPKPVDSQM